jgi:hypothetical protein
MSIDTQKDLHLDRIISEYLEMPGLTLSVDQARRLWMLDREETRLILSELVELGFLRLTSDGLFVRAVPRP